MNCTIVFKPKRDGKISELSCIASGKDGFVGGIKAKPNSIFSSTPRRGRRTGAEGGGVGIAAGVESSGADVFVEFPIAD